MQHRVLLFCQLKAFLDIIENDLFSNTPGISYLRLDGSINMHMGINVARDKHLFLVSITYCCGCYLSPAGDVKPADRHSIVRRFNADPVISVTLVQFQVTLIMEIMHICCSSVAC